MIKFFRKIRQNLLKEGKTTRYFKYAIGEIVLVVIGILIALQINTSHENRMTNEKELVYLQNIKANLQIDLQNLNFNIKQRQKKIEAGKQIIQYVENSSIENADKHLVELSKNIFEIINVDNFNPNNITFTELISSGNVNIISNDRLKNLLLSLEFEYQLHDELIKHEDFDYKEYISKPYFNTIDFSPMVIKYKKNSQIQKPMILEQQYKTLLRSTAFKNGCSLNIVMSESYFLPSLRKIEKLSKQTIELINSETKQ